MAEKPSAALTASSLIALIAIALIASACTTSSDDSASPDGSASTSVAANETTSTEPAPTSTTAVAVSTESSASEFSTTDTTTEEAVAPTGIPCPDGTREAGFVTGVFEFVNLRDRPSSSSDAITELPADSLLETVKDTDTWGDDRQWIAVVNEYDNCGWVANEYIGGSDGKLLAFISADEYVRRALFGLGAEASHATFSQDGAEAPEVPLDDSGLSAAVAELRQIGTDNPMATVRPDASVEVDEGAPDGVGCIFGDGLFCQVEVLNESGEVIAVVGVGWYGDGITGADVTRVR